MVFTRVLQTVLGGMVRSDILGMVLYMNTEDVLSRRKVHHKNQITKSGRLKRGLVYHQSFFPLRSIHNDSPSMV